MKYINTLLIIPAFFIASGLNAATFNAQAGGGDYNNSSTWSITSGTDPDGIPDANDNVSIGSGITVTVTVNNQECNTLTIASGAFLTFNSVDLFTAHGIVTVNGTINGTFSGANQSFVKHTSSGGFAGTTGTINITGNLKFLCNATIPSGLTINNTGNILIEAGFIVGISGPVTLTGSVDGASATSQLQCLTGSTLTVQNKLMATAGIVTATTAGYTTNNTIIFDGASAYSLGASGFENVIIRGSGIKTTSSTAATTFNKSVTIDPGATLAQGPQSITWNGPMTNNGTFTGSASTITYTNAAWTNNGTFTHTGTFWFSGAAAKTMSGTGLTTTFGALNVQSANVTKTIASTTVTGVLQTISKDFNNSVGTLTIRGYYTATSGGTLTANAIGNTVIFSYPNGIVPAAVSGYYNLTMGSISAGTKTLTNNTVVANKFTVNALNTIIGSNISVGGNWLNNASYSTNTGKTVTFNGSSAQTVSNTLGTTTFTGLTINNNAGVTLTSGSYILSEVLTVSSGTFNTGGRPFTMTSTAAKTARIAPIGPTGAIAGNFTIQRFITARDTSYADLTSPVQGATFVDWDNELPAISYVSAPPSQQPSTSYYDETADAYVGVTSSGTALNPGQGFEVFLSGDFSYAPFPATTMNTIGIPNQGDFDLSSSISNNAEGWNLVGNPFASSVSWTSIYNDPGTTGLWDFIEMYDYTIGDWNGYTTADAIEIGSTQGFWVYGLPGNGPVSLYIPETAKTTASNSSIKSNNRIQPYFTLNMSSSANSFSHLFKVAVADDANNGLDNKDIPFRASPNKATPALYTLVDGKKININTLNSATDSYSMPLQTKVNVSGKYTITVSGFDFIPGFTCVKLQDNLTGQIINLTEQNTYTFTMNSSDNVDRFILHLSKDSNCKSFVSAAKPNVDFASQVEILPTAEGNMINFNLSEATNTTISIVNILGQQITEPVSVVAQNQSLNVSLPEDFTGMYMIQIKSAKASITKKFVKK